MHLQAQWSLAPGAAVGVDHLAQLVVRLVHGDQPVGPGCDLARGGHADRGADQVRRRVRQGPEPRAAHGDESLVGDLLASEEPADDLDALPQSGVADLLGWPRVPGDVLIRGLPGAESGPDPTGEHGAERAERLGDDRRVVTLSRGIHDTEGQARRGQRSAEPGPREARVSLALAPRHEVVRGHRGVEPELPLRAARPGAADLGGSARASSGIRWLSCARWPLPVLVDLWRLPTAPRHQGALDLCAPQLPGHSAQGV